MTSATNAIESGGSFLITARISHITAYKFPVGGAFRSLKYGKNELIDQNLELLKPSHMYNRHGPNSFLIPVVDLEKR